MRTDPSILTALSLSLSLGGASCAEPSQATDVDLGSRSDPFRTASGGDHDHADMTADALWFFDDDVVEELGDDNEATDSGDKKLQSRYHFDNCRVIEGMQTLEQEYERALAALDPDSPRLAEASARFGNVLHTAQDFYAHSNWVETGHADLFSSAEFALPSLAPGGSFRGLVVLVNDLPASYRVEREDGSRVPQVFDGTSWRKGLITGTYPENTDPSVCHPSGSIWHGPFLYYDPGTFLQPYEYDSTLAKDAPQSPHHEAALALAKDQTVEEFCRLERRVRLRYGARGAELLLSEWVDDRAGFAAECPDNLDLVTAVWLSAL